MGSGAAVASGDSNDVVVVVIVMGWWWRSSASHLRPLHPYGIDIRFPSSFNPIFANSPLFPNHVSLLFLSSFAKACFVPPCSTTYVHR